MRRALLSDIHGNLVALEAALADCEAQKADEIVCLGDICGYGPQPIECVDLIRQHCKWVLAGNHDMTLFMSVAVGFNRFAREAIEWQRSVMQPYWYSFSKTVLRWQWLGSLSPMRLDGDVLYVHASPRDPIIEYVEEADFADMGFGCSQKAQEIFERIERLSFCGHSHRPGVVTQEFHWTRPHLFQDMTCTLQPGDKTLVNIGSVGQPRDGNPQGCYVIHDDVAQTVTFRRVAYDIQEAQERFKQVPRLSERLWRRLEAGR
ncbi:MAG: metallophosphoesterase family protein [Planctomycetota bacterium]|nr:metallophosphoesterase family protein [Planctomycetota bacterium]